VALHSCFDLSNRVAIVTGGSRGLGLEIAHGLAEAGARVAVTARRETWLNAALDELRAGGVEALGLPCDVTSPDDVGRLVAAVEETWGRVDVLVNNAGISWGAPVEEMPLEKWRQVLDTNVTGPFLMCRAVAPLMKRAGRGSIVNVASVAGLVGSPPEVLDAVGYAASKGALVNFTRDLAVKWAKDGIRVNAIAPGYFRTRLSAGVIDRAEPAIVAGTPMGRIGREGELKGVVVFLASDAASYVTGQVLAVDGGATAV
jgi:gluconate 5-dehydrogenase